MHSISYTNIFLVHELSFTRVNSERSFNKLFNNILNTNNYFHTK